MIRIKTAMFYSAPRRSSSCTAITMSDGKRKVILAGGRTINTGNDQSFVRTDIYDVSTGVWSFVGGQNLPAYLQ